jgi:hypothetical protein
MNNDNYIKCYTRLGLICLCVCRPIILLILGLTYYCCYQNAFKLELSCSFRMQTLETNNIKSAVFRLTFSENNWRCLIDWIYLKIAGHVG